MAVRASGVCVLAAVLGIAGCGGGSGDRGADADAMADAGGDVPGEVAADAVADGLADGAAQADATFEALEDAVADAMADAMADAVADAAADVPGDVAPEFTVEPAPPAFPTGARLDYPDLLDRKATPSFAYDNEVLALSDAGAWHGLALPARDRADLWGGFSGPLLHSPDWLNAWLSESVLVVRVLDGAGDEVPCAADPDTDLRTWPGAFAQHLQAGDVTLDLALVFADARTAIVRLVARAPADREATVRLGFRGDVFALDGGPRVTVADRRVVAAVPPGDGDAVVVGFPPDLPVDLHAAPDGLSWTGRAARDVRLPAGGTVTRYLALARYLDADEHATRAPALDDLLAGAADAFAANDARWNAWIAAVLTPGNPWTADADHRAVAVKALETLAYDWRGAWRDLRHDGVWPAAGVNGFHGLWGWDSWKHAAALARFDPALAKDQVRAMLDWQRDDGMIPDTVTPDHAANYWRCTKPPLAAWAVAEIQARSPDPDFLAEVVPKILAFHRWRFAARDHDGDGLCEWGSTADSPQDGGNDSGMDNAMRFDGATMLENGPGAYSFDRESVDLNAYLWAEKLDLADLLDTMGDATTAAGLRDEADALGARILQTFWDEDSGWFYDVRLADRSFVKVQGPEGWTPLYVGLATPAQAARVRAQMTDPAKFWTTLPFPTVAADTPNWEPAFGYWRGPVWLDQTWFGVQALQRYGFADDAREAARRMIEVPQGLFRGTGPFRENYDPRTGVGTDANDFGWSAAHVLLLYAP